MKKLIVMAMLAPFCSVFADEKAAAPAEKTAGEKQADTIKAPMPCKVVKVNVIPGQELQPDYIAVTIEAMKMQSNITVSEACTVAEVKCAEGDSVMADQVLVTLKLG